MAKGLNFTPNRAGYLQVMKFPGTASAVNSAAAGIAAKANSMAKRGTYETVPAKVVGDRQMALSATADYGAMIDNAKRSTLSKAMG